MPLQHIHLFATDDPGQSNCAVQVQPRPPIQHLDREAFVAQLPAKAPQFIEADEQETVVLVQGPRQPRRLEPRPAHFQGVQNLADRGAVEARRCPGSDDGLRRCSLPLSGTEPFRRTNMWRRFDHRISGPPGTVAARIRGFPGEGRPASLLLRVGWLNQHAGVDCREIFPGQSQVATAGINKPIRSGIDDIGLQIGLRPISEYDLMIAEVVAYDGARRGETDADRPGDFSLDQDRVVLDQCAGGGVDLNRFIGPSIEVTDRISTDDTTPVIEAVGGVGLILQKAQRDPPVAVD